MYESNISQEKPIEVPSNLPENYYSKLPIRFGVIIGLIGSVVIMLSVAALSLGTGESVWLSARVIASTLLGESAASGVFPVILGTIMHLISGAVYGALFAFISPRMPRGFWIVAGLLFGIVVWLIALITLPLVINLIDTDSVAYFNVLLISHVIFGLNLGVAGSLHGYRQRQTT